MTRQPMDLKVVSLNRGYRAVPFEKLVQLAGQGRIGPDDQVRIVGTQQWVAVQQVPELAAHLRQAVSEQFLAEEPAAEEDPEDSFAESSWKPTGVRRQLEDSALDMTPIIDVTFQLLIFFIFSNQLANPNPVLVPEAQYGRGVSPDGKQAVLVDDQGQYYLGESTKPENATTDLEALAREVTANAAAQDDPLDVIVSAHKDAKHLEVRMLVELLGDVDNIGQIRLGVEETQ